MIIDYDILNDGDILVLTRNYRNYKVLISNGDAFDEEIITEGSHDDCIDTYELILEADKYQF